MNNRIKSGFIILLLLTAMGVFGQNKVMEEYVPKLKLPIGHANGITSTKFYPDGNYILTTSQHRNAKVWEVSSGKET